MQSRPAAASPLGEQGLAQRFIGGGHFIQALDQGLEVQQGATHQQRQAAARIDLADQAPGILREARCAVALGGVEDVDEVVGNLFALARRGLGRADVQASVDQG